MVAAGAEERYIGLIALADTEEDLDDLADYFHFYFPEKRQAMEMTTIRRPGARDRHLDAEKLGYADMAKNFGITAAQFGENLWNNQMVHTPVDNTVSPEEMVAEIVDPNAGRTLTQVIANCRAFLARQIANDPYVRNSVRDIYTERLTVSTFPTEEKGIEEITYWHPFRNVKRLEKVPLSEFRHSDLFALILDAEKNGYIRVELDVGDYLDEMLERYNSKSYDPVSLAWNKQRRSILTEALSLYLHPRMKKLFRNQLQEQAFEHIAKLAAAKLFDRIGKQPLPRTLIDMEDDYRDGPMGEYTMAISVPADREESPFVCVVDEKGNLLKFEKVSFIEARGGGNRFGQTVESRRDTLKNEDIAKVQDLVKAYRPGLIAVSVHPGSVGARLAKAAFRAHKGDEFLGPILEPIRADLKYVPEIEWLDGSVSHVFRNTATGMAEFPQFAPPLRECVSVARCAVNSLAEYSRLWDEKWAIGYIPFHPLQHMVPQRTLKLQFEQAFIRATCMVGVDINDAWRYSHLSGTLQFVPGLGPRKAKGLIKTIELSGKSVDRRTGDLKDMLVGQEGSDVVYVNSIAYLRIVHRYENEGAPLDNSRIHPSDSVFAYKIAVDALENVRHEMVPQDDKENEINEMIRTAMLEDYRDDVVRVEVEGMARVWKENYNEEKLKTLISLKEEMLHPFKELREKAESLTDKEAFEIYSGESDDSLPNGKLMKGVVRSAGKNGVRVDMEDGVLSGFIRRDMLSDREIDKVESVTNAGYPIAARLMQVNYDRWELELSSRQSDLDDHKFESYVNLQEKHPYLKWRAAEAEKLKFEEEKYEAEKARAKRRERQGVSTMRVVDHPSFRNFTVDAVAKALEDAPCGEAIFRPSTKGLDFLTLSFKGLKDQVVHVVVVEKEKPNPLALGRRLSIKGFNAEEYEDLDEVIARYVNPVAQYMNMLSQHRRFCPLAEAEVEALVREEKKNDPKTIAYRIGIDEKNPGWFKIFFVPNENTVHHEVISLRPTGFRLRSRGFGSITEMLTWWKKHWRDKDTKKRSSKRVDRRG
jgi:transcription elongation factor SPT6